MRYALWPMACVDGTWSVPDEVLADVWAEIVRTGKAKRLFYNGTVINTQEWLNWTKTDGNYFILVVNRPEKKIASVGWINAAHNGYGLAHFCILGLPRPEMGRMVLEYWKSFGYFHVLIGITPETFTEALRYVEKIGFKRVGVIPHLCELTYEGKRVGGVISYCEMKEVPDGRRIENPASIPV